MGLFHKILALITLLSLFSIPVAFADTNVIAELSKSLMQAKTNEEKCRLHMFRARNYNNLGNIEKAEEDYNAALQYDHKGWIHLERARFYLKCGNHEQARKEATAAEQETPTLKSQAQQILAHAKQVQKKEKIETDPEVILLTKRWKVTSRKVTKRASSRNIRAEYAANSRARQAKSKGSSRS